MDAKHHSMDHLLMELLIENGPEAMLAIFTAVYNMGMKIERERFIGAEHYERAEGRRAYAPRPAGDPVGEIASHGIGGRRRGSSAMPAC